MKRLSVIFVLIAFVLSAVACGGGGTGTEVKFKDGAPTEFAITNSLVVENYVDTSLYEGYVLTITDSSGKEETISGATWRPSAPGQYTLKLTVGENSAEMKITVTAPDMTWTYANASPIYDAGAVVQFDDYIEQFNIVVTAYNNDYELFVDRIIVDGTTIDVSEQDSYTLTSTSAHTVVIKAVSGDGQELELNTILSVREVNAATQAWMEENDITIGGNWLAIKEDNTFRLGAGSFTGNLWDGVSNINVPYVALNGDYSFDDAVTVTFTGRYAPDIAFFVGEETTDRTWAGQNAKGLIAYNGLFLNNGDPENATESGACANIETAGNFMMNKGFNVKETEEQNPEEGNEGARKWPIWSCPASWYYLEDDHEYRYTMYYSQLDRLDDDGITPIDSKPDKIKLVLIVEDLTTDTVIFDNSDLYPAGDTYTDRDEDGNRWYGVFDNDTAFDNADFFTGNILIYGKFGNVIEFKIEEIPQKSVVTE